MLKTIRPESLTDNFFSVIGKEWMLITACTKQVDEEGNITTGKVNTMTASWGGIGILWNKPVATIYLRPSRYTKEIIDSTDTFSLSVLTSNYKNALNYCGSHSGRDEDKIRKAKLHVEYLNGTPWIKEARMVLFCEKLYHQELAPEGFENDLLCRQNYRNNDFHTMYIGEIYKAMIDKR